MIDFVVPGILGLAGTLAIVGYWLRHKVAAPGAVSATALHPAPGAGESVAESPQRVDAESIIIDPVAMKIVNRVAPGTRQVGQLQCAGGLIVEGTIEGEVHVSGGPLVLMPEGVIVGKVTGDEDAYLFGTIRPRSKTEPSDVDMLGAVFLTETLRAQANITAGAIKSFDGAQVEGRIKTGKRDEA